MTDNELVQALQYCAKEDGCCERCAMQDWCDGFEEVLLQASNRLDSLLPENGIPTTNSDYVRRLNDDELADFLVLSPEMEFNICCLCKYGNTSCYFQPEPTHDGFTNTYMARQKSDLSKDG